MTVDQGGILSVGAQGFTPEFSLALTRQMLIEGEAFINEVGQNIARQEIAFVEGELERAKDSLSKAQRDLLSFQAEYQILSPEADGEAFQNVMSTMKAELVRLQAEEKVLTSYLNERAPEVVAMRARIDATERQLAVEQDKLSGTETNNKTLGEVNLDYKELELRLSFATSVYQTTFAMLEKTKVEGYRKLKHLVIVQSPTLPEEATLPRRVYNLVTIFVLLTLVYGIAALIIATVKEHRDA